MKAVRDWLCILAMAGIAAPAQARQVPRWEAGMGLGVIQAPDYRGADEQTTYVLPVPYLFYRSGKLSVDREGVQGQLAKTRSVGVYVSVGASIPVNSGHNQARAGMPDLDPAVEIGPSLFVPIAEDKHGRHRWSLGLPMRAVAAGNLHHAQGIGWVFAPHLDLRMRPPDRRWETILSVGPMFATQRYHAYYYRVDPLYATATRPAYEASGGYSGTRASVTLSRRNGDLWMGFFVRYDDLHGAAFVDSPLVKRSGSLMVGGGVAYVFAHSSETVEE